MKNELLDKLLNRIENGIMLPDHDHILLLGDTDLGEDRLL